jgi:hypothetical protein
MWKCRRLCYSRLCAQHNLQEQNVAFQWKGMPVYDPTGSIQTGCDKHLVRIDLAESATAIPWFSPRRVYSKESKVASGYRWD